MVVQSRRLGGEANLRNSDAGLTSEFAQVGEQGNVDLTTRQRKGRATRHRPAFRTAPPRIPDEVTLYLSKHFARSAQRVKKSATTTRASPSPYPLPGLRASLDHSSGQRVAWIVCRLRARRGIYGVETLVWTTGPLNY